MIDYFSSKKLTQRIGRRMQGNAKNVAAAIINQMEGSGVFSREHYDKLFHELTEEIFEEQKAHYIQILKMKGGQAYA